MIVDGAGGGNNVYAFSGDGDEVILCGWVGPEKQEKREEKGGGGED